MKYFYAAVTLDIINDYCFSRKPDIILGADFGRKSFDDVDKFLGISLLDNINKILALAMTNILDFRRIPNAYVLKGSSNHISANSTIAQPLHEELKSAIPDPSKPLSISEIEKLPYLTTVIQEGLRLADPVTHEEILLCHGKTIPVGTIVSMTALLTHQNETIFPEPKVFTLESWLETEKKNYSSTTLFPSTVGLDLV
ncbi:hypothetical protein NHQ30_001702 [Ciborinia camelliae]|nr:hypothetical protein NHQ30_001702 [Ciborinia camelliae]